ncbi:hypothetical protein CFB82_41050 [Burkholderia sp. HI2714]|nr:hypothetical protein CFB82_41050 [Burkholderia sp. HI2714]
MLQAHARHVALNGSIGFGQSLARHIVLDGSIGIGQPFARLVVLDAPIGLGESVRLPARPVTHTCTSARAEALTRQIHTRAVEATRRIHRSGCVRLVECMTEMIGERRATLGRRG